MESAQEVNQLVEHLFRHETGRMIAVLAGVFGASKLELVEDIVQDTLIEALQNWTYKGIPHNPTAWLYKVAKNKTLNALDRENYLQKYISNQQKNTSSRLEIDVNRLFSEAAILDDQLRLMFMCCHPAISKDSQIALILKTLCGFSIAEVAKAFLSSKENINKRLVRARKSIREDKISFEVPAQENLELRIGVVLEVIYLLFNEGYSASNGDQLIRNELCEEAIRLVKIIIQHDAITDKSNAYALLSLMQLNASRFKAREDKEGNILTLEKQDRTLWDFQLMEAGFINLDHSLKSGYISFYHILASISAYHCSAKDFQSTNWEGILELYDKLLLIDSSPLVRLNRAIVLSRVKSLQSAMKELEKIESTVVIRSNYLFYSIKSDFYSRLNKPRKAKEMLQQALRLAPLAKERNMLEKKLNNFSKK